MIDAMFTFVRAGLEDDAETLAENVNGRAGKRCAEWLKDELAVRLKEATFDNLAIAEDWGWAMIVRLGRDLFLLGCSNDDDAQTSWRVLVGDNFSRGVFPWTRRRKTAAAKILADALEAMLREACVGRLRRSKG